MYARPGLCWQQCGSVAPVPGGGKETTSERALRLRVMSRYMILLVGGGRDHVEAHAARVRTALQRRRVRAGAATEACGVLSCSWRLLNMKVVLAAGCVDARQALA